MAAADQLNKDRQYMVAALRLAKRALGTTMPNPAVGALVVDGQSGEVIARGWTQPGGRPHAETEALRCAGMRARGATLYSTLEPCSHHGRTPPCVDAIIAAGIRRVVAAIEDPNDLVAGQGFKRLEAAGVSVTTGVLAGEARWMAAGHLLRVMRGRPFVTLKLALDRNFAIAHGDGGPVWVTGSQARARGHLLRARADAILVGGMTVRADDPELTCRLPGLESRSPIRIVLAPRLGLPLDAKLTSPGNFVPVWFIVTAGASAENRAALEARGVRVIEVQEAREETPWIVAVLTVLAERGITRLLVEGGPRTWHTFLTAGVADEIALFLSGQEAPNASARVIDGNDPSAYLATYGLKRVDEMAIGDDRLIMFHRPL
jgi:diaminohydroxyphosphoribosylaminopyrimidine deaminase / 5-amino-6-(5-phosphoribosylamino)uracil reductase